MLSRSRSTVITAMSKRVIVCLQKERGGRRSFEARKGIYTAETGGTRLPIDFTNLTCPRTLLNLTVPGLGLQDVSVKKAFSHWGSWPAQHEIGVFIGCLCTACLSGSPEEPEKAAPVANADRIHTVVRLLSTVLGAGSL